MDINIFNKIFSSLSKGNENIKSSLIKIQTIKLTVEQKVKTNQLVKKVI